MRAVIDSYAGRVLIGEIYLPIKDLMAYYGQDLNGANLPFNFLLLQCPWNTQAIAQVITEYSKQCCCGYTLQTGIVGIMTMRGLLPESAIHKPR